MVTKRKKSNKIKRFPYIMVEGIETHYLDVALLRTCGPKALENSLSDEFKIIKKAGISVQELKKNTYSYQEVIKKVSPYLLESYDFYNFLARQWDEILHSILDTYFSDVDYTKFTVEEWDVKIKELYKTEMPIHAVINFLRFYKNGELKELIQQYFEENESVIDFYEETGIKVEGVDIDWDGINYEEDSEEDSVGLDNEEVTTDLTELIDQNPQEALLTAAQLVLGVTERFGNIKEAEAYKEMYEYEKEKTEILQSTVDRLTIEFKSKDSQNQALSKENRNLSKNVDALNNKLESLQKENGRLGGLVGEIRKEKETLEKNNSTLEKRVTTLEKEAGSLVEVTRKAVEAENVTKVLKIQMDVDETINELENQNKDLKRLLDNEQANTANLSSDLEEKNHKLLILEKDLLVVEKERNELLEKLNMEPQTSVAENDDDLLFGFDEKDLEDFVEFDNKPTRN